MSMSSTGASYVRSVVKFNTSSIPAGSTIISASLLLDIPLAFSASNSDTVDIYRLTTAFAEGTVCSNAGNVNWTTPWTTAGGDYSATNYGSFIFTNGQTSSCTVDVTALVQYWASNPALNYGMLMKLMHEPLASGVTFYTRETSTMGTTKPTLTITYRP
jgi:hypothetical protein